MEIVVTTQSSSLEACVNSRESEITIETAQ